MKKALALISTLLLLAGCSIPIDPTQSSGVGPTPSSTPSGSQASSAYGKDYVVTFDPQNGSGTTTQTVEKGQIPSKPADPSKDGSYFAGWYFDQWGVAKYYFDEVIGSNATLYAKWSASPVDPDPDIPVPELIEYKIVRMPEWVTNDGCVIFAWAWGGNFGGGAWAELQWIDKTSAKFRSLGEIDGMVLARCASGTGIPDWGIQTEDKPGRVYNQTSDIQCSQGDHEYACSDWFEYPKKEY